MLCNILDISVAIYTLHCCRDDLGDCVMTKNSEGNASILWHRWLIALTEFISTKRSGMGVQCCWILELNKKSINQSIPYFVISSLLLFPVFCYFHSKQLVTEFCASNLKMTYHNSKLEFMPQILKSMSAHTFKMEVQSSWLLGEN